MEAGHSSSHHCARLHVHRDGDLDALGVVLARILHQGRYRDVEVVLSLMRAGIYDDVQIRCGLCCSRWGASLENKLSVPDGPSSLTLATTGSAHQSVSVRGQAGLLILRCNGRGQGAVDMRGVST